MISRDGLYGLFLKCITPGCRHDLTLNLRVIVHHQGADSMAYWYQCMSLRNIF